MKTLAHNARPQPARGAKLRNLFKQIVMRVEKERNAWSEFIDLQTRLECGFHVSDRIRDRESDFLNGGRAGFANVIAANRDRVPVRNFARAESERVGNQAQRRLGRKDVRAARDIFFENIVLERSVYFVKSDALFARDC